MRSTTSFNPKQRPGSILLLVLGLSVLTSVFLARWSPASGDQEPRSGEDGATEWQRKINRWSAITSAKEAGDCRQATKLLHVFVNEYPPNSLDTMELIANLYLECGRLQENQEWLQAAITYLESRGAEGIVCNPERALTLGNAHQALQSPAEAARAFASWRPRCAAGDVTPLEWQLHFLIAAGDFPIARELVEELPPGPMREHFRSAVEGISGDCGSRDMLENPPEYACQSLPRAFCNQRTGIFLYNCGDSSRHFKLASGFFERALDVLQTDQPGAVKTRNRLLRFQAESEYLAEDFQRARVLFEDLLTTATDDGIDDYVYQRYADSILFSSQQTEDLEKAREYYLKVLDVTKTNGTDKSRHAMILNNFATLQFKLIELSGDRDMAALRQAVGHLDRALGPDPPSEESIVENCMAFNLAQLKAKLANEDPTLTKRERLRELKIIQALFRKTQKVIINYLGEMQAFVKYNRNFFAMIIYGDAQKKLHPETGANP